MSEGAKSPEAAAAPSEAVEARPAEAIPSEAAATVTEVTTSNGVAADEKEAQSIVDNAKVPEDIPAIVDITNAEATEEVKATESTPEPNSDAEMEATRSEAVDAGAVESSDVTASANKSKARRKSGGVLEHKGKKLNKKASKAKMNHIDAKPGDYFYIRLKGYPLWPGIICDNEMLPESLVKSRPVTAARPDGTYREDFEDGGKNVYERTFPVMYLSTNEFGWIPNYDLVDIDLDTVGQISNSKMRKDLYEAHLLAAEKHDLDYFKELLADFERQRAEIAAAKAATKAAKAAGKKKSKTVVADDDEANEDTEMVDAAEEVEEKPKPSKKRKATDDGEAVDTPQRSESVKKPKFKPIVTPKAIGTPTPKASTKKDASTSKAKAKSKKAANGTAAEPAAPEEPEMSPEEKRKKKEKEILFYRHKLQKGLLTREQQPKEEEMKSMSDFITKLEAYAELEVSIIRATKINKVLKGILKIKEEIPREEEFHFKERSQNLLSKWNKILDSETPAQTNGTSKDQVNRQAEDNAKAFDGETKSEEPAAAEEKAVGANISMADAPAKEEPAREDKVETTEAIAVEATS